MLWCIIASVDNQLCPISTKHNKNNVRKTFKHQDSIISISWNVRYILYRTLPRLIFHTAQLFNHLSSFGSMLIVQSTLTIRKRPWLSCQRSMGKKPLAYLWKIVNNCTLKLRYEEEYRVLLKEKALSCSGKYYISF